ncbi:hypothetical protein DW063_01515 [Ruminococcus sp. AF43-11]|nr:hypothetical protein DW063_01515 [Ruminococcus sp. AF43-11]
MPEKKITKAIVCPMCGEMSKADVYTSINPSVTKGVRRRALDGELFAWKCPSCGYSARLTYPILYNDMKNRFMVYFIPKIDHFQLCDNELEEKYSNLRNISKRIVPTSIRSRRKFLSLSRDLTICQLSLQSLQSAKRFQKSLTVRKFMTDTFQCTIVNATQWDLHILQVKSIRRMFRQQDLKFMLNRRKLSIRLHIRTKN